MAADTSQVCSASWPRPWSASRQYISVAALLSSSCHVALSCHVAPHVAPGTERAAAAPLAYVLQDSFKRMHSFSLGDSAEPGQKARYTEFFARLAKFAHLEEPWTVVIRWAADCSVQEMRARYDAQ